LNRVFHANRVFYAEQANKAVDAYVKDAEALQLSIAAMTADVDVVIAVIM
jgi:hypothetical protein